ncbi:MAG TPA: sulfur carrier protein ThiS [Acidobacteriaceae bacterium]|jgi:sulfur carrier protein|nr:sulfur carrier protein ThiS [Acidobacteriaceae bacterium]
MQLFINGQAREFPQLAPGAFLHHLIDALELKGDRIAVEHNGVILPRGEWDQRKLANGDKVEIVHFVGGGCEQSFR